MARYAELTRDHRGFVDWVFRSRETGRITLFQRPNWQLLVWLAATVVLRLGPPQGTLHDILRIIATAALGAWAADEVIRGVNPFRRLLGAVVLGVLVLSVLRTL